MSMEHLDAVFCLVCNLIFIKLFFDLWILILIDIAVDTLQTSFNYVANAYCC